MSNIGRLRWRCRRGMRELDAVLERFLERDVERLSDTELACFEAILELPDAVLYDYLVRHDSPTDSATARLIERIRSAAQH